ncbi:SH3 domain-containing protein [Streptomyces mangrovisoli]|uniref:SH3b domain-containing protein n=1 Tax=Streptomyces mangrovisoli TaxID=1428628 RepID=A0A1J4P498_9ACTN|nr:SH3 domain-containing protein [Streptomyces mangrovisoli]OIJ69575.1 hypothetical protein WN71_001440 [Streptomyces mangrovisoli]
MRTTLALRTLTAALLAGGGLAVAAAGTAAAAAPVSYADGNGGGNGGGGGGGQGRPVWATITSHGDLSLRMAPTTRAPVVGTLESGSQVRVQCQVKGQTVDGNPYWYWVVGAKAWASAAFVNTDGQWVRACADPMPQWRNDHWTNWDDPFWNDSWTVSGSFSWSITITR